MSEFAVADLSSPDVASVVKIVKIVPAAGGEELALDGTGVYIGPHQVLTAAHVVFNMRAATLFTGEPALRAYVGAIDVGAEMGAAVTSPFDVAAMPAGATLVQPLSFDLVRGVEPALLGDYNAGDIALLSSPAIIHDQPMSSLGIAWGSQATVASQWNGVEAASVGYPRAVLVNEPPYTGEELYRTTDTLVTGEPASIGAEFRGLEIRAGQGGSGVWTVDPESGAAVLIGIVSMFDPQTYLGGGLLLTRDDYIHIAGSFEAAGVSADEAPVEYLYGADNASVLGGGVETITGTYLREVVRGDSLTSSGAFAGNDALTGGGGGDLLQGMGGDDVLVGDGAGVSGARIGNDFLDGGRNTLTSEHDIVLAGVDHTGATAIEIGNARAAHQATFDAAGYPGIALTDDVVTIIGSGGTDFVRNVETISLVKAGADTTTDTLAIYAFDATALGQLETIDLAGGFDVIDLGNLASGMSVTLDSLARYTLTRMDGGDGELVVWNANSIIGTAYDDKLQGGHLPANAYIELAAGEAATSGPAQSGFAAVIDGGGGDDILVGGRTQTLLIGGSGNDVLASHGTLSRVEAGDGNDTIKQSAAGTAIYTGEGSDKIFLAGNTGIMDASADDKILGADGFQLFGGYRWSDSESLWARGLGGFRYAKTLDGELAIEAPIDRDSGALTYIANYQDGLAGGERTADLIVFEILSDTFSIGEDAKAHGQIAKAADVFYAIWKAMTGTPYKPGVDPLVLDLDGDGFEVTEQTDASPAFDLDGDGFAELTGWVGRDDGLLVRDLNGDGAITTAAELFAGPGPQGFAALAALDSNGDGRISVLDTAFGSLRVWRDRDGDAVVDAGELATLAAAGLAEIGITATPDGGSIENNVLVSTGSFTRADGTAGRVGSFVFTLDQSQTTYLGGTTPNAAALTLPDLKGYGDLPSLRVAMTEHAEFLNLAQEVVPGLVGHDLAALRTQVAPLLAGWAALYGHTADSVPMLVDMVNGKPVVRDYAFFSPAEGHWVLASGRTIVDASGAAIAAPTLADVLEQDPQGHQWRVLSGGERAFVEAQFGSVIPIGTGATSDAQARDGLAGLLELAIERIDTAAVRLLVQGPLHDSYFANLRYDAATDRFVATSDAQLAPTFQAILAHLPSTAPAALTELAHWKEILFTLIGDFDRGATHLEVTYDFLFANLVAGYEALGAAIPVSLIDAAGALGLPSDRIVVDDGSGTLPGAIEGEIYYLDAGADHATGGSGKDVYVVGRNFGNDVIDDHEGPLDGSPDLLRFASLRSSGVSAERQGTDLMLTDVSTGDTLRIVEQFEGGEAAHQLAGLRPNNGVEEIAFADGVVWDRLDMARAVSRPSASNDTLTGSDGQDVLDGGAGNDTLSGGDDADIYVFGRGYGQDTIDEHRRDLTIAGPDYVELAGVDIDDVAFFRDEDSADLTISIAGTTDTLTIQDQFHGLYTVLLGVQIVDQIEALAFNDGLRLYASDIMDLLIEQASTPGDDRIFGFYRADELDGGRGNDFLSGGDDGDIYHWGKGGGNDVIDDNLTDQNTEARRDSLELGGGLHPADVAFTRIGRSDDLVLTIVETGETLTIVDQFKTLGSGAFGQRWFDRIEDIVFSDGTHLDWEDAMSRVLAGLRTGGDDTIYGFDHDDVLDGGAGDDLLLGLGGNDVYVFGRGYGHDTIDEAVSELLIGQLDMVRFTAGVSAGDLRFVRGADQADLDIEIIGTSDVLTIRNAFFNASSMAIDFVEELHFADGTVLDLEAIKTRLLASEKTDGDDLVRGFDDRADTLDGGAGNDRLEGYNGSDTYVFNRGYGADVILDKGTILGGGEHDEVAFGPGVLPADIRLERQDDDLVVRIQGTGDQLLVEKMFYQAFDWYRIETFRFADGTVWSFSEIQDRLLIGTPGDDVLDGFNRPDVLDGKGGDDLLTGRDGDDTYIFGIGCGHDTIHDKVYGAGASNFDTVVFGAGILPGDLVFSSRGTDLTITLPSGDSLTILQQLKSSLPFNRVEAFRFADGTVWNLAQILAHAGSHTGTTGDDTITGGNGNERFEGLAGNDYMAGGAGSDAYVYDRGDGDDIIFDYGTGTDRLYLGESISPADVSLLRIPTGVADQNDVRVEIAGADAGSIYLDEQLALASGLYGIEEIVFADGTLWSRTDIALRAVYRATEGPDDIRSGNDADVISGLGGDDIIQGNAGADVLHGNDGDDTLRGNGENDTLYGDAGNDTLDGGDNIDTLYGGDGNDTLIGGGNNDILYGEAGDDVFVHGPGNDVVDGGDGIDTADYSAATTARTIDLATGATGEDTLIHVERLITGSGADQLTGDAADNEFISNGGADVLHGGGGNDILRGGAGNDQLFGDDGDDWLVDEAGVDTFDGGAGTDTLELSASGAAQIITMTAGAGTTAGGEHFTGIENLVTGAGDDRLTGDGADNAFASGAGNDTLAGGAGDDRLDGGAGSDTARFSGLFADYRITASADGSLRVADQRAGGDGTDTLVSIETLVFADVTKGAAEAVNQGPSGIALRGATIAETAAGGTVVGLLSATDPNGAGDVAGFALIGAGDGPFEIAGNELRLAAGATLDFETAPAYPVTVRVTDRSGATLDRPFTIIVTDVNEAPTGVAISGGDIREDALPGTPAAQLAAIDPDHGDSHSFSLPAGYAGPFELVGNEIRLKAGTALDFESAATHALDVVVTDRGGLSLMVPVVIHVTNVNEAPSGVVVSGGLIGDGAAPGTVAARLTGVDPDAGDTTSIRLDPSYVGPFELVGQELRLKSGAVLDHALVPAHAVPILVSDAAGLTLATTVTIAVTDDDAAPDALVVTGGVVSEALAAGAAVATLNGHDADADDVLSYALAPDYAGPFEIIGNQIRLKAGASLDFETAPEHVLVVTTSDPSGLSRTDQVTITVTDINEAPTGLEVTGGTVAEDAIAGDVVARLSGIDPDRGDRLTYALPSGYAGPFEIAGDEIRLKAGAALDADTQPSHALQVTVRDAGGLTYARAVLITVTDAPESEDASDGRDVLHGRAAADIIDGLAGNDWIAGGGGADYLFGNAGADVIYGNDGNDVIDGGAGADTLLGGAGDDILLGGGGHDRIMGQAGDDRLEGNEGDDCLSGGAGDDVVLGGAGSDRLFGKAGADTLLGGVGDDWLVGGAGDDWLAGGSGDDRIEGGAGADRLEGGAGDDRLSGGGGDDTIATGRGADTIVLTRAGGHTIVTDFENDVDALEIAGAAFDAVSIAAVTGGTLVTLGAGSVLLAGISVRDVLDDIALA